MKEQCTGTGGALKAQMSCFDLSDRYASLDAKQDPPFEYDAVVPWEEFRPALERVWRKPEAERKSRVGRKPTAAVLMFKTLVLSALYNLSPLASGQRQDLDGAEGRKRIRKGDMVSKFLRFYSLDLSRPKTLILTA